MVVYSISPGFLALLTDASAKATSLSRCRHTSKVLYSASLSSNLRLSRTQSLARSYSSVNPITNNESIESTMVYPTPPAEVKLDPPCDKG